MKNVNLQIRINEELKQEVAAILKEKGLSYTSMLDALFRQIIEERRIPFAIELPAAPVTPQPNTLDESGHYIQPQSNLKASEPLASYGSDLEDDITISFDKLDKDGVLNIRIHPKVKTLVSATLKELGLTMSQTILLISKQIQLTKDIPNTVQKPMFPDCVNGDFITDEELEVQLEISLKQIERGEFITWEELKSKLEKEGLL